MPRSFVFSNITALMLILGSSQAYALAEAPSFYRSINSKFPSGQTSRIKLEDRLLRVEKDFWVNAEYNNKELKLPADQVVFSHNLSMESDTSQLVNVLKEPKSNSEVLTSLDKGASVKVRGYDFYWAQVQTKRGTGYLPWHLLKSRRDDLGYMMTLAKVAFRKNADSHSEKITDLPARKLLLPLKFEKGYAKVINGNQIGYVDLAQVIHRSDFSHFAYFPPGTIAQTPAPTAAGESKTTKPSAESSGWVQITHREKDQLITPDGRRLNLSDVKGFFPSSDRGFVASSTTLEYPTPGARLHIKTTQFVEWGVSLLDGHGEVFWKKLDINSGSASNAAITTDELLQKPVFQMAFDPNDSSKAIVSSDGVYFTMDGMFWRKVKELESQNVPVMIDKKGKLFAGSYMSVDQGETFEPFIRWDQVAEHLGKEFAFNPRNIKLQNVESDTMGRVTIQLASPQKKIKLQSEIGLQDWRIVK